MTRLVLAACISMLLSESLFGQQASEVPVANPARPTVSTPATLTPVGYLQFETGVLGAWNSPELGSQVSVNEVVKLAVAKRLQLLASFEPFAHTGTANESLNGNGDIVAGIQGVVRAGEGAKPTVSIAYLRRAYNGSAPDLDIGSFRNSLQLLVSADVKGFHYDTNYIFNEIIDTAHRAQFGQTLSVSHPLKGKFGMTGEIWHFTQPFLGGHAVGNLWALTCNARNNLVFDGGFDHGFTSSSTRWEVFAGFTYVLPHKLRLR